MGLAKQQLCNLRDGLKEESGDLLKDFKRIEAEARHCNGGID